MVARAGRAAGVTPLVPHLQRPWRLRLVETRAELYAQVRNEPSAHDEYLGVMDSPTLAAHVVAMQDEYLARTAEE